MHVPTHLRRIGFILATALLGALALPGYAAETVTPLAVSIEAYQPASWDAVTDLVQAASVESARAAELERLAGHAALDLTYALYETSTAVERTPEVVRMTHAVGTEHLVDAEAWGECERAGPAESAAGPAQRTRLAASRVDLT